MLIQGARDAAPKFNDISSAVKEGFNSAYAKTVQYPLGEDFLNQDLNPNQCCS